MVDGCLHRLLVGVMDDLLNLCHTHEAGKRFLLAASGSRSRLGSVHCVYNWFDRRMLHLADTSTYSWAWLSQKSSDRFGLLTWRLTCVGADDIDGMIVLKIA